MLVFINKKNQIDDFIFFFLSSNQSYIFIQIHIHDTYKKKKLFCRLNVCHYALLLSKITGLIQGWNKKSLSYAGKLELIRAVIQGIVNFWMRIFPLPQSVIDQINASCRNFLWGKADIGKNKPLVAWSVVCSPKKEGGLSLFNLKDWNLALLSRILWDFHCKKDSLWVR